MLTITVELEPCSDEQALYHWVAEALDPYLNKNERWDIVQIEDIFE